MKAALQDLRLLDSTRARAPFVPVNCVAIPGELVESMLFGDRHPAMVRVREGGVAVAVEMWAVPLSGIATILLQEPPGLSVGKVLLTDGSEVLGLGEPVLCEGQRKITSHGGWLAYRAVGRP